MKKTFSSFAIATLLAVGMASAVADPVVSSGTLTRGAFETADVVTGNPSVDGDTLGSVYIGAMNATFDPTGPGASSSFLMFCADLFSPAASQGLAVNYKSTSFLTLVPFDKIGKLITFNGGLDAFSNTPEESAAMQLAIWELIYDDAPGDVTAGAFKASGVTGDGTRALANELLAGAAAIEVSTWDVVGLSDNSFQTNNKFGYQDYITAVKSGTTFGCNEGDCGVTPVPEPSSIALTLAGLIGIGVVARRRKTQA